MRTAIATAPTCCAGWGASRARQAISPRCRSAGRGAGPSSGRLWRDRKSTRLNSSHANISYAVFCLKKKKKLSIVEQRRDTIDVENGGRYLLLVLDTPRIGIDL